MYIVNTLAPVFLIIILGAILQRIGFLSPQLSRQSNSLVYWVSLPCLLFNQTARAGVPGDSALKISLVLVLGAMGCVILAYLTAWLLRLSAVVTGAFVQASFRGNLAYIGLPVVIYALSELSVHPLIGSGKGTEIQSLAILSFAPLVPLYNALAVFVLVTGSNRARQHPSKILSLSEPRPQTTGTARMTESISMWSTLLRSLTTNPLLLACGLGLSWNFLALPLPLALSKSLQTLGQMALPLALLGIGVSLATTKIRGKITIPVFAALIKVVVAPILGLLLAHWLSLSSLETAIALLYLACPTAIASHIMAQQLGGDEIITSNSIVFSTLLSAPTLAFVLSIYF